MTNVIALFKEYDLTVKTVHHDIQGLRPEGVVRDAGFRVYEKFIKRISSLEKLFDEYKNIPETNEDKEQKLEKNHMKAANVKYSAYSLKNDLRLMAYYVKKLQEQNGPEYYNEKNALKLFKDIEHFISDIMKFRL